MKQMRPPPYPADQLAALGERLAALVADSGLTVSDLAGRAGLTEGAVRHYLAGRATPALGTLHALAAALGRHPAELLGGRPPAGRKP